MTLQKYFISPRNENPLNGLLEFSQKQYVHCYSVVQLSIREPGLTLYKYFILFTDLFSNDTVYIYFLFR